MILLTDENLRVVEWIRRRLSSVINDGDRRGSRCAESCARRVSEVNGKSLVAFYEGVFVDEHPKGLGGFTGRELQFAERGVVIPQFVGGNVGSEVVDGGSARGVAGADNGNRQGGAILSHTVTRLT